MERLNVMEYKPSGSKSNSRTSTNWRSRMITSLAPLITGSLLIAATTANGALLKINPDDSPNNVIQLEGDLTATVTHTAEGMTIDIPGVEITLDCGAADSCTIAVGSAASDSSSGYVAPGGNDSGGNDSGGNDSGGNDSGDTAASQEEYCANNPNGFGCGDAYEGGSSGDDSGSADNSGSSDDGGSDDGDSTTNGFSQDDGGASDDPCANVTGFNPDCANTSNSDSDSTVTAFPTGGSRKIDNVSGSGSRDFDFGSGGNRTQNSYRMDIAKGVVKVAGFTMMGATYQERFKDDGTSYDPKQYTSERIDPFNGQLSYGPIGNITGVGARLWISKTPDGDRVSAECSSNTGYVEGAFNISVDGSQGCNLEVGGDYYLNVAVCSSDRSDYRCSGPNAKTANKDLPMIFQAVYK